MLGSASIMRLELARDRERHVLLVACRARPIAPGILAAVARVDRDR